jgi:hypothetical protein
MKARIIMAVSALLFGLIAPANANLNIQSPLGLTESEWWATDTFKNFSCPLGYGREEGVNMNFTVTRADDIWYANCVPVVVYTPQPNLIETSTVITTPSSVSNVLPIVVTETSTAITETSTAIITSVTVSDAYAEIMALLIRIFQLLAILNR